ncbi:hypothetical protein ABPG75_013920 [Micractinium tetrahymenae]
MQRGPLSEALRCSAQAATSASSAAAAANLLLQEAGSAAQPLVLLRALSSASACSTQPEQAAGAAAACTEDHERRLAAQRQHRRQLSHYSASTSGRAAISTAAPALGASGSAAAWRRGPPAGLAARWRAFSSSSAAAAAARRPHSSSPERSFASQPAYAYEQPDYDAAAAVEAAATLQRAQQAVETLKARARERLEEARAMAANTSPYGAANTVSDLRRMERVEEVADLVKVQKVEEMSTEAPVWERLVHYSSGWHRGESMAALHLYRQEVQMGHDADALNQGSRGAAGHSLGHVPFLRSGLLAAQQGFGLQCELSRAALPARLAPGAASAETAVSPRTRSALQGLQLAMDLSRSTALQGEGEEEGAAEALHVLAAAEAAVAAAIAQRGGAMDVNSIHLRSSSAAAAAEAGPALAEAAAAHDAAQDAEEEVLLEESQQGGLLETLDWQERLRHENLGERLSAAKSLQERRQSLSAAMAAAATKPRGSKQLIACPTPTASQEALLAALAGVKGLQLTAELRKALEGLYARPRPRHTVSEPLALPEDPAECAARMAEMAQLLIEELGSTGFQEVVAEAPWVLLLDPARHGHLQLAALHLVDLSPSERARVVRGLPRLLQINVDQGLLPMMEYLQSLGMSTGEVAHVLLEDPYFAEPQTLPLLKSAVAFWRGKGMSRECLIKLIMARPEMVRTPVQKLDLKLSWLADHTGFTLDDMARCGSVFSRGLATVVGPRIAFAQHKGLKVANPTEVEERGRSGCRTYQREGAIGLRRMVHLSLGTFLKRVRTEEKEYEAFREKWLREDFPAWLQRHRPGIEHYRTLTRPPRPPRK